MSRAESIALDAALQRCRETHTGVNPCFNREYLRARRAYHLLLYKAGRIAKADIEPEPT